MDDVRDSDVNGRFREFQCDGPAIIGALGFAFCSYTPIALTAGHDTKMFTLAYVPATLAAMVLIFDKKYLWGFTLTALFTAMQLGMNHQQINFYFFMLVGTD